MNSSPDFVAELTLLATMEGGRRTPMKSGYRGGLDMGLKAMHNDGVIELVDMDELAPGHSGLVRISMLCPEFQEGRLHESFTFDLREGNRRIGYGKIIAVLNTTLQVTE